MSVLEVLIEYRQAYLSGIWVTLQLCAVAWCGGLIAGGVLALLCDRWPVALGLPLRGISRTVEAIPILVLLFWAHYPLQSALGIVIPPFVTMATLLTGINLLTVYGIIWQGIRAVPREYIEAATVCGVPKTRIYWRIKIPLALRNALGALTSSQILVLHLSIFGSLISVQEIFRVSQQINAVTYRPTEVYSGLAVFFLCICLPLNLLAAHLHKKYSSERA